MEIFKELQKFIAQGAGLTVDGKFVYANTKGSSLSLNALSEVIETGFSLIDALVFTGLLCGAKGCCDNGKPCCVCSQLGNVRQKLELSRKYTEVKPINLDDLLGEVPVCLALVEGVDGLRIVHAESSRSVLVSEAKQLAEDVDVSLLESLTVLGIPIVSEFEAKAKAVRSGIDQPRIDLGG